MKVAVMDTVLAVRDAVTEAGRLGFSGVEVTATRAASLVAGAQVERLRRRAEAASLEIHALVLGDHNRGGIASGDRHTAESAAEEVRLAIGLASELGAGIVLIPFFLDAEIRTMPTSTAAPTRSRPLPRRRRARSNAVLRGTASWSE